MYVWQKEEKKFRAIFRLFVIIYFLLAIFIIYIMLFIRILMLIKHCLIKQWTLKGYGKFSIQIVTMWLAILKMGNC